MEQVTQFKYLGSIISSDGYCEKAARGRKWLQMLGDVPVISKCYEDLKREVKDRSWWKKRAS